MNFTSRFSIYDLIAMVFPGCFIIWCLMTYTDVYNLINQLPYMESPVNYAVAYFVTAYMLGLIWNMINGYLWRKPMGWRKGSMIKSIMLDKGVYTPEELAAKTDKEVCREHERMYAYVRQNDKAYTLNVVEGQISLLRNMAIPFSLWVTTIFKPNLHTCCCVALCIVVCVIIYLFAVRRQYRMYSLIIDGYIRLNLK